MSTASSALVFRAELVPESARGLLAPNGAGWDWGEYAISLEPTPLTSQPSAYVRASFENRPYGQLATVRFSAVVTDLAVHIRLRWEAPDPRPAISDNHVFADACALLFPLNGRDAELSTMGDSTRPVQAWHWRAGADQPFVLNATGIGTTSRVARHEVAVVASWEHDEWSVVFSRALAAEGVPLRPGTRTPIGIAVWIGSLGERAGLKSHTPEWLTLELPA